MDAPVLSRLCGQPSAVAAICAGVQSGQLSASGRVAPSGAALDADDVAGETDQDRREGGAPFAAGDLPDGGGGNPTGIVPDYSGKDWMAEIAHAAARLMLAGRQMRESKMADGDALSAFGRETARNAIEGSSHLTRRQKSSSGAAKRLDSSVRGDKMPFNETEWPAMVAGVGHMGNVGQKHGNGLRMNVRHLGRRRSLTCSPPAWNRC